MSKKQGGAATEIEIHPAANCFRLMNQEEIESLTEDIKVNGLRDPITMGQVNGYPAKLVDGRNRLTACRRANIEPRFEVREFGSDEEVRAFVKSRSSRRDLTKGERAASLALLYPKANVGGVRIKGAVLETKIALDESGVSASRLSQARQVGSYSQELLEAVRDGHRTLDEALAEAKQKQDALNSDEIKLKQLQAGAPDLAEMVREERMRLSEAHAAFLQRRRDEEERERNKRETMLRVADSAFSGITAWASQGFCDDIVKRLSDPKFRQQLLSTLRPDSDQIKSIKVGAQQLTSFLTQLTKEQ